MAQIAKLEIQVELKSSAERVFEILSSKLNLLPKVCPEIVQDIKLIKGDWNLLGSIREWSYVAENTETAKDMIEELDEEKKLVTLKIISGDVTKYYNNVLAKFHVTGSVGQKGCSVKWTLEYEKVNANIPDPTKYGEVTSVIIKCIDAYLIKNA